MELTNSVTKDCNNQFTVCSYAFFFPVKMVYVLYVVQSSIKALLVMKGKKGKVHTLQVRKQKRGEIILTLSKDRECKLDQFILLIDSLEEPGLF